MRPFSLIMAGLALLVSAGATTLQRMSLEDMIRQSTGIVRARVAGSRSALHGQNVYTYYRLEVLETAKQDPSAQGSRIEVAVPGGVVNGVRDVAVGAPELSQGAEYVVFLWTGKSGLTQIIGLSQGLFQTARDASGSIRLTRAAADDLMLDGAGRPVASTGLSLTWSDLRAEIRRDLNGAVKIAGGAKK